MIKMLSSIFLVIGGVNWGIYGLFSFDCVAWLCGGSFTVLARIIYILVGASAIVFTIASLTEHRRE
ncbi:MAG: DUF378 domain-containing protein [Oscillospiraceae bacterium]